VTWLNQPYVWDAQQHGAHGTAYHTPVDQATAGGLPPGEYRLELFLGESQAQVGTFIMYDPDSDAQAAGQAALASLVQVAVPYGGEWYLGGSGSIVNGELGLILTNWHVLVDENSGRLLNDGLAAILLLPEPGEAPLPDYWAEVLPEYSDPDLDLAVLRIRTGTDGRQPVVTPLNLPAIRLGDSDSTSLGDRVLLLGYPDYATAGPSWTEGIVATRNEEWILSDAQASHGHSGGMMLNEEGELTGVLTGYAETSVGGGFVRARPINLAAPLIAAAEAGE
jgi:S1-C subfamily serine protease